ncbi:MAG: hypothetical protein P8J87_05045, partial [Verrucomicrobiales bacterium]|nr:hypothetical protein [Verrucomicrobiales bacterium]
GVISQLPEEWRVAEAGVAKGLGFCGGMAGNHADGREDGGGGMFFWGGVGSGGILWIWWE